MKINLEFFDDKGKIVDTIKRQDGLCRIRGRNINSFNLSITDVRDSEQVKRLLSIVETVASCLLSFRRSKRSSVTGEE